MERPSRRLRLFLAATFVITWGCWWTLAAFTQSGALTYGRPLFMALYLLGGLAPTIAAYFSVVATRRRTPLREFHARLLRWRMELHWYAVAFALPVALGLASIGIARVIEPGLGEPFSLHPWRDLVPLFLTMIVGGGLEELGWRGVAQPEFERWMSRLAASGVVGVLWAAWHFPLFYIPGVTQYGGNFWIFAIDVVGTAFVLAWLYAQTRSILLCVIFHAATNTSAAMGLAIPASHAAPLVATAIMKLLLGFALIIATRRPLPNPNELST